MNKQVAKELIKLAKSLVSENLKISPQSVDKVVDIVKKGLGLKPKGSPEKKHRTADESYSFTLKSPREGLKQVVIQVLSTPSDYSVSIGVYPEEGSMFYKEGRDNINFLDAAKEAVKNTKKEMRRSKLSSFEGDEGSGIDNRKVSVELLKISRELVASEHIAAIRTEADFINTMQECDIVPTEFKGILYIVLKAAKRLFEEGESGAETEKKLTAVAKRANKKVNKALAEFIARLAMRIQSGQMNIRPITKWTW